MDFYAACQVIDNVEGLIHMQTNQTCGHNCQTAAELILVAQHVKTAMCNLVSCIA